MDNTSAITLLLNETGAGKTGSFDKLIPLVYDEMKHMARRQLGHGRDSILNTNVLVHEAYLKLNAGQDQDIRNRNQFLRVCSVVMRNVVIDAVRRRQAAKRGAGCPALTFNEEYFETENQAEELLALDQALDRLEEYDPMLARVVECRYFTGLTEAETAGALSIGERTVRRHWVKARTLLHQMLTA
jgi:RNA polymerase sigma factor (TIGR02999 family)